MDNLPFLEKVLASTAEYWVVAKETSYRQYFESKRGDDDIILIAIPSDIKRPVDAYTVSLGDIRKIADSKIKENIYLTGYYPPFQYGLTLGSFYNGFSVEDGIPIKEFMIKALQLESSDWFEYKKLAESMKEAAK